jgi:hypothetical protein
VVGIARWWSHGSGLSPELGAALLNTLRLSALGALATVVAALPIAWLAVRRRGPLSTVIERCAYLTSSLPGVVVALALVTASVRLLPAAYQTSALVLAGYVILFLPRALVCLRSVFGQIGPELDEVARTSAAVANSSARLAKVERLAACLRRLEPGEVHPAVAFLSGELRQRQIGVGWAAVRDAPDPAAAPTLTVAEVDAAFERIGRLAGPGSQAGPGSRSSSAL